ncbi:glycosyltransferase family 4 protein [Raineyella fluvialis]|uniref:glycosyltransferase family 4 protein n=1 Tax=Raineyella fluvialis TaxID=2662261 RepID=UPI00188EE437|nr:glycosyltransferase family 4 protein [Raineyella fluvialis]
MVYEYAYWIAKNQKDGVIVHHVPVADAVYTRPVTIDHIRGLASRELRAFVDRPKKYGVPWFPATKELECRYGIDHLSARLCDGDIVIATAAQTALHVGRILKRKPEVLGVNFIQHLETWSTRASLVEAAWRLPMLRIVIAPWLEEHGKSLGVESLLVPNAIDPSTFEAGEPVCRRAESVVAMLSDAPFKRADVLIAALVEVSRRRPGVVLTCFGVGPRPEELPSYIGYIRNPSRSEVAALMKSARVYVCASDAEGWHLPPAEALLSGTAVASTDIGGVRAYADGAALFSPPGDSLALAENTLQLLTQTDIAQSLVAVGHERLRTYSPDDAAAAFWNAVQRVREPLNEKGK